jgi:Mrp family chromosome partitioning ATPase/capsular polysaccharide biosynthesis protein
MLAAMLAALAYVREAPTEYVSSSRVVVNEEETKGAPILPDMGTERAIAMSGAVARPAAEALDTSESDALSGLEVSVPVDTAILQLSYTASSADEALEGSRVFTDAYVDYRNSLQRAELAKVITPPSLPDEPEGVNYPVVVVVSLLLGAAAGVGAAAIWDRVSGRMRDAGDAEERFGVPMLTSVPHVYRRATHPTTLGDRSPAGDKAFGYLTARLSHGFEGPTESLVLVTSPVAGAGTTFVASHLSVALATVGRDVILVSSDVADENVRSLFVEPEDSAWQHPGEDLEAAIQTTDVNGLRLLTVADWTGSPDVNLEALLGRLGSHADIVVFDAPPTLSSAQSALLADRFESIVLVADLDRGLRSDAVAAMRVLGHVRGKIIGFVGNHPRGNRVRRFLRASPGVLRTRVVKPAGNGARVVLRTLGHGWSKTTGFVASHHPGGDRVRRLFGVSRGVQTVKADPDAGDERPVEESK